MSLHQILRKIIKRTSILLFVAGLTWASCVKKENTTNNYFSLPAPAQTAFLVQGVSNVVFTNDVITTASLNITVLYQDSMQQHVRLSLSPLPAGIAIDTTWATGGTPTFSTMLNLYDTGTAVATPGTYPMTLTATTDSGVKKTYPFTLKILSPETYHFFGKYTNCTSSCDTVTYSDSIYADPKVANRIWFSNFANSKNPIFGTISANKITIPPQGSGSLTISAAASATVDFNEPALSLDIVEGTKTCTIRMN